MKKIQVFSRDTVFDSPLFTVKKFDIEINGKKRTHFDVVRNPTVSVFPITPNHEIYLVSQYRYLLNKTMIEAVAGFIDNNEEPLAAAQRELHEETGLRAKSWEALGVFDTGASVVTGKSYPFLARDLTEGIATPEETEDIRLLKMPIAEAVDKIKNGEITSGITVIGLLMIEKKIREGLQ